MIGRILGADMDDDSPHLETIAELERALKQVSEMREDLEQRLKSVVAGYECMRRKLDLAFGAPDSDDPRVRRAQGRTAGLEGAVDWAIARYAARQAHLLDGAGYDAVRLRQFARVALDASYEGCDWDGGDIQAKALELGLIREVECGYDPAIHGEQDLEPGETFYVETRVMLETNDD